MTRSNWDIVLVRVFFIAFIGVLAGLFRPFGLSAPIAVVCGICTGSGAYLVERRIRRATLHSLAGGLPGLLVGGVLGLSFVRLLNQAGFQPGTTLQFFKLSVPLLGVYLALLAGIYRPDLLDLRGPGFKPAGWEPASLVKILDTSVLIDGRIPDIAEAGFLEGKLVIPQFVLHELQFIADSPDSAKQNRGRRGPDVVQRLQKIP